MKPVRVGLSPKERFAILERDGFACQYCGARAPDSRLYVDHIVPVVRGGSNDPTNLTTSCFECNAGKSTDRVPLFELQWRTWRAVQQRFPGQQIGGADREVVFEIVHAFVRTLGDDADTLLPLLAAQFASVRSLHEWHDYLNDELAEYYAHFGTKMAFLRSDRGWNQLANPTIDLERRAVVDAILGAQRVESAESN